MTLFDAVEGTAEAGPAKVRMVVAYDGTDFHGFAEAADVRTVAGTLRAAIAKVTHHDPEIAVAGRTDKGVHAWGNVVSFEADPGLDPWRLQDSLNGMLGPEIVVRESEIVDASFDARRSATWRHYRYTILNRPVRDPFRDRFVWWVPDTLDLRALRTGADVFIGEHDFASFCRKGPEGSSTTRRVLESRFLDEGDGVLVYEIRASAFCWQMVRSIVGTLVEVGRAKRTPGELMGVLRARDRGAAGQVAPPGGLCLFAVGETEDGPPPS